MINEKNATPPTAAAPISMNLDINWTFQGNGIRAASIVRFGNTARQHGPFCGFQPFSMKYPGRLIFRNPREQTEIGIQRQDAIIVASGTIFL